MKKLLVCILAAMPLLFASCESKNDLENPKGDVGEERIVHVGDWVGEFSYSFLVRIQDGYMESNFDDISIASIGKVSSLKAVNYVPTSGWRKHMEIIVGNGYVIKGEGYNTYTRIRILERIDKGGAIGYRIRIQDNWDPLQD